MTSSLKTNLKHSILFSIALMLGVNNVACADASATGSSFDFLPSMDTVKGSAAHLTKAAAIALIAASCIRLWTREGDNEPLQYDLDELLSGEKVGKNLFYLWDDGVIGQFAKGEYLYYDKKTNTTKLSTSVAPKGLGGWVAYYYKGILVGLGTAWFAKTVFEVSTDPEVVAHPENFFSKLKEKVEAQTKLINWPDFMTIGLGTAVGTCIGVNYANAN